MLQVIIEWLLYTLLKLDSSSKLAQSLHFFLYDSIKIILLLFLFACCPKTTIQFKHSCVGQIDKIVYIKGKSTLIYIDDQIFRIQGRSKKININDSVCIEISPRLNFNDPCKFAIIQGKKYPIK